MSIVIGGEKIEVPGVRSCSWLDGPVPRITDRTERSRRTCTRFPLIVVAESVAITSSATASGTSTMLCRSQIWIAPIALASIPISLVMAPTMSPGRIFSFRPAPR